MKNDKKKEEQAKDASPKKTYDFGTVEKIVLEAADIEQSVFALMHGVDGCDPRIGTLCSAQ